MRRSSSEFRPPLLERLTIVMLGVYLAAVGAHTIATGHLLYRNYMNGTVLAPIAMGIGALLICAGISMRR